MSRFGTRLVGSFLRQTFLANQRRFLANESAKKNFYETLGIPPSANESEIKKAYLKLAKKYHPDVCKEADASKKFQEVSEAYEILSDKSKRQEYDAFQSGGFRQGFDNRGMGGPDGGFNFHSTRSANDIFEEIFGKGFKFAESSHGFDSSQEISVRITFEESARGVQKTVNVNVIDACDPCRGSGVATGFKKVTCSYCNGTGMVTKKLSGFFMQSTCSHCRGQGLFNKNPCLECEGTGNVVKNRATSIYIPPGIDNDQTLRMQLGYSTIYVRVQVSPSLIHKRIRENIYTDVEIGIADAALGTKVAVPGINGDTNIEIPAGTSSHAQLCLKGKGMKRLNNTGFGDQYVNIKIGIPKTLTPEQRDLMLKWQQLEPKKAQAKSQSNK